MLIAVGLAAAGLLAAIDFNGWSILIAAIATAITGIVTACLPAVLNAYLKLREDQRKLGDEMQTFYNGVVLRGFIEAENKGHLTEVESIAIPLWTVSLAAREAYKPIVSDLQKIYKMLAERLSRAPTDGEIGRTVEGRLQRWLAENACKSLGVNQHGCLAIACVLSREESPS